MAYDRTLIQIRERTFLDILDLSLVVVRRWPRLIALAALSGVLPFAIFDLWLFTAYPELPRLWWVPLLILESPWATAPLTLVLGGLLFGERPRPARIVRRFLTALPTMILNQLIVRGLLLATVVFYLLFPARLSFLNEVVLLERAGGFRPIRRCTNLCNNREGDLIGRSLALVFFSVVFVFCFTVGIGAIGSGLIGDERTWADERFTGFLDLRVQFSLWLTIAFSGIVRFLAYIDQRIRLEGWAVELSLRDAGLALEKSLS
jgi:hypothetical protein